MSTVNGDFRFLTSHVYINIHVYIYIYTFTIVPDLAIPTNPPNTPGSSCETSWHWGWHFVAIFRQAHNQILIASTGLPGYPSYRDIHLLLGCACAPVRNWLATLTGKWSFLGSYHLIFNSSVPLPRMYLHAILMPEVQIWLIEHTTPQPSIPTK